MKEFVHLKKEQQQQKHRNIYSRRNNSITNQASLQPNSTETDHFQPEHVRKHRIWSILFLILTPTTFFFFLLFMRTSLVPRSIHLENRKPSIRPTIRGSKINFEYKDLNAISNHPLRLPLTYGSSIPLNRHIPNPLNILLFFSQSVETHYLDRLDSILKDFPPYSLTTICSPSLPCPETINSLPYHSVGSLDAYEPPMSSDMILVLDADSLPTLDKTWLSNAARITLSSPRIAAAAGITLSSSHSSMTCTTPNGEASIALAPFVFPTRSWPPREELRHLTTSLDLSLHLATHLDWSSIVVPLENSIPHFISQVCHNSIQKLIKMKAESPSSNHQKWPQHLDPKVGIVVTESQLNLSNWSILACQLVQKFKAQIYFLQERHENLVDSEKFSIKNIIQNTCTREIQINFVTPSKYVQLSQTPLQGAISKIIQTQNSLELIFYFFDQDDLRLPHSFKKLHHHRGPSNIDELDEDLDDDIENGPNQSDNDSKDEDEECVLISLPAREILTVDWILGLDFQALKNWHKPQIDISVITNDRSESLKRLLNSLETAAYYGDRVNIIINMEQNSDQKTRKLVESFQWKFGSKVIRQRIIQGGLLTAVIESWYPSSAHDSYGVLLEDDVEVSGYFYGWLKFSLLNYRYSGTVHDQIYGISLYQPQHNELRPEGRRPFNATELLANLGVKPPTIPYGSQVPCSWGALFFPEPWVGFQRYLTFRLADQLKGVKLEDPVIPSPIRSNRWSKSWKKYMIEWVYLRGLFMIYPNYHDRLKRNNFNLTNSNTSQNLLIPTGLSTNHLELGTHVHNRALKNTLKRKTIRIAKWDDSLIYNDDQLADSSTSNKEEMTNKLEKLKKEFGINLKKLDGTSSLLEGLLTINDQDYSSKFELEKDQVPKEEEENMMMNIETSPKLPNLNQLIILDFWGEISNLIEIKYRGLSAALSSGLCDDFDTLTDLLHHNPNRHYSFFSNWSTTPNPLSFPVSFSEEYLELLSNICQ